MTFLWLYFKCSQDGLDGGNKALRMWQCFHYCNHYRNSIFFIFIIFTGCFCCIICTLQLQGMISSACMICENKGASPLSGGCMSVLWVWKERETPLRNNSAEKKMLHALTPNPQFVPLFQHWVIFCTRILVCKYIFQINLGCKMQ